MVPFVERTLWHQVAAPLQGGDGTRAEALLGRFAARIDDNCRRRVPYLCALATLARWQGDSGRAVAHLEAVAALADGVGLAG